MPRKSPAPKNETAFQMTVDLGVRFAQEARQHTGGPEEMGSHFTMLRGLTCVTIPQIIGTEGGEEKARLALAFLRGHKLNLKSTEEFLAKLVPAALIKDLPEWQRAFSGALTVKEVLNELEFTQGESGNPMPVTIEPELRRLFSAASKALRAPSHSTQELEAMVADLQRLRLGVIDGAPEAPDVNYPKARAGRLGSMSQLGRPA